MRLGLAERKLSQMRKTICMSAVLLMIALSTNCLGEDDSAKGNGNAGDENLNLLRIPKCRPFIRQLSQTNDRSSTRFLIRFARNRSNRLKTNQDNESKPFKGWGEPRMLGAENSIDHFDQKCSFSLVVPTMKRGPPKQITSSCSIIPLPHTLHINSYQRDYHFTIPDKCELLHVMICFHDMNIGYHTIVQEFICGSNNHFNIQ